MVSEGAKQARNNTTEAALRIYKNWREKRRDQAARVIQKHWRQGLVRNVSPGTAERYGYPVRPVHRSRVVSHNGKKYNARTIMLVHTNYSSNSNNNGPNGSYWPGTRNVIDRYNKNLVQRRSLPRRAPLGRRVDAMLAKVKAAMEAYKRGRFEPYRKAGWGYYTFHFNPVLKTMEPDYVARFPMCRRWSGSTVTGVLKRLVPTPDRFTGLLPWPPWNDTSHVIVFT